MKWLPSMKPRRRIRQGWNLRYAERVEFASVAAKKAGFWRSEVVKLSSPRDSYRFSNATQHSAFGYVLGYHVPAPAGLVCC